MLMRAVYVRGLFGGLGIGVIVSLEAEQLEERMDVPTLRR
jgi:hypothetical protein